jgi:type II secretory pathway pseudopilin PulG
MQKNNFVYIRNHYRKTLRHLTTINSTRLINITGVSLFEFVLVLIIFTILASVLIPKFVELQDDVHQRSVQLSANSLRSAVNIVHRVWQSQGSKNEVVMKGYEGGKILVGRSGWPIDFIAIDVEDFRHDSHIQKNTPTSANKLTCQRLWNGLLKDSSPKVENGVDKKDVYLAEFHQKVCRFRYLLNEDDFRIEYDLATGQVSTFFKHKLNGS